MGNPERRQSKDTYTVKDLAVYSALFAGIIGMFYGLQPFGLHHWVRVGCGLVVGMGMGWLVERNWPRPMDDDWPSQDT